MVRLIWFMKRKPGMSFEQFQAYYEGTHAPLGMEHFGHLFLEYRRHYDRANEAEPVLASPHLAASGYDCIAEWVLRDEACVAEWRRLLADPVVGKIVSEDSDRFLDRGATRVVVCDTRETRF